MTEMRQNYGNSCCVEVGRPVVWTEGSVIEPGGRGSLMSLFVLNFALRCQQVAWYALNPAGRRLLSFESKFTFLMERKGMIPEDRGERERALESEKQGDIETAGNDIHTRAARAAGKAASHCRTLRPR